MYVDDSAWFKSNPTSKAVKNIPNKITAGGIQVTKYYSCWNTGDQKITAVGTQVTKDYSC
jgi:hypothetical protein